MVKTLIIVNLTCYVYIAVYTLHMKYFRKDYLKKVSRENYETVDCCKKFVGEKYYKYYFRMMMAAIIPIFIFFPELLIIYFILKDLNIIKRGE